MKPPGRIRRNKISEQFSARTIRMLESPAYRALSLSAHRVLSRIEIELGHHGGADNGKLPVTYNDFVEYGVHRHAVGPAIRECVALGFLEVTEQGKAGNAEFRSPNKFRITFLYSGGAKPTHEWQRIETPEQAEAIAHDARQQKTKSRCRKTPRFGAGNHHRNAKFSVPVSVTTVKVRKPSLLSISRVGDTVPFSIPSNPSTPSNPYPNPNLKPVRENFVRKRKPMEGR